MSGPVRRRGRRTPLRWARAAPLVASAAALALVACGSDGTPDGPSGSATPAVTCSDAALGRLVGGPDGVIQVSPHGKTPASLLRIDPRTGAVVSRCVGATAVSSLDPGPSSLVPQSQAIPELGAPGGSADTLPDIPLSRDNAAAGTTSARDWRTGRRTALRLHGYRIVSVTSRGVLVQTAASATYDSAGALPRVTTADDFCVLPTLTAGRAACRPVPGAVGAGFPLVHVDGSLGWAPLRLVPATFGSRRAYVATDGTAIALPWPSPTVTARNRVQPPDLVTDWGRVVLFDRLAATGSALSWGVVTAASSTAVDGTLHSAPAAPGRSVSFDFTAGCTASADGSTLSCLRNVPEVDAGVEVITLRDGSSTVTTRSVHPPRGEDLTSHSHLVYWPAPTTGA